MANNDILTRVANIMSNISKAQLVEFNEDYEFLQHIKMDIQLGMKISDESVEAIECVEKAVSDRLTWGDIRNKYPNLLRILNATSSDIDIDIALDISKTSNNPHWGLAQSLELYMQKLGLTKIQGQVLTQYTLFSDYVLDLSINTDYINNKLGTQYSMHIIEIIMCSIFECIYHETSELAHRSNHTLREYIFESLDMIGALKDFIDPDGVINIVTDTLEIDGCLALSGLSSILTDILVFNDDKNTWPYKGKCIEFVRDRLDENFTITSNLVHKMKLINAKDYKGFKKDEMAVLNAVRLYLNDIT